VEVVLTLRIYAVTKKSVPVTVCFGIITVAQLVFGVFLLILVVRDGAQKFPEIPLDSYRMCIFIRHRHLEIVYTSISLIYEFLAFSLLVYLVGSSKKQGLEVPRILRNIVKDAMWYFLVIFTSHLGQIITLAVSQDEILVIPASGNVAYLPVMISRMILSLREAGDLQLRGRSPGEPTSNGAELSTIRFFRSRAGTNRRESDIPLDAHSRS